MTVGIATSVKAITTFNYDSSIRYDFVITEDFNKSNISLSDYEKFAVINEKIFEIPRIL